MDESDRAVTSVISIVLLVAIAVVLAATVSVFSLGFLDAVQDPAPHVAESSGEFLPQDGDAGGIVQIRHLSGDAVTVSDLEISVRATCDSGTSAGLLVNLPAGDKNAIKEAQGQIEGENIFDEQSLRTIDSVSGVTDGGALLHQELFSAGDTIIFRIPDSKCSLSEGTEVSVDVIHVPSNAVIIEEELTA